MQIGQHSIPRTFLKLFQRTRILPMGFTISTMYQMRSLTRILVRLGLDRKKKFRKKKISCCCVPPYLQLDATIHLFECLFDQMRAYYLYMYVYIYTYIHTYIHTYIYTYTRTHSHTH